MIRFRRFDRFNRFRILFRSFIVIFPFKFVFQKAFPYSIRLRRRFAKMCVYYRFPVVFTPSQVTSNYLNNDSLKVLHGANITEIITHFYSRFENPTIAISYYIYLSYRNVCLFYFSDYMASSLLCTMW